jgi:hypothetical protein
MLTQYFNFNIFTVESYVLVFFSSFLSGWHGLQILDEAVEMKKEPGIILQDPLFLNLRGEQAIFLHSRTCPARLNVVSMGTGPYRMRCKSLGSF